MGRAFSLQGCGEAFLQSRHGFPPGFEPEVDLFGVEGFFELLSEAESS